MCPDLSFKLISFHMECAHLSEGTQVEKCCLLQSSHNGSNKVYAIFHEPVCDYYLLVCGCETVHLLNPKQDRNPVLPADPLTEDQ